MTFQAVNAFLLHLKGLQTDCFEQEGKKILQKSILACYAKTNEMLQFETIFTDNDKSEIIKEFMEYESKIDNDNKLNKFFYRETNKITDNYEITEKGFTAVPSPKNGNVKISKVGFSAVPNQNNGNFEICNVGFTAVPNQNNGKSSIVKRGLSVVPLRKNGTNYQNRVGFSAVPITKNGNFENLSVGFSPVPNQNNGNGSFSKKGLSAVPSPKNGMKFSDQGGFPVVPKSKNGYFEIINSRFSNVPHKIPVKFSSFKKSLADAPLHKNGPDFVKQDGFGAKQKKFRFLSDKNLKFNFSVRFDNFMSRTFSDGNTNLGGRGHRFILTLESRFPRFKNVLKKRLCLPQKKHKIYHF